MSDERDVENLVEKLRALKEELPEAERESFAEMIKLAVKSAQEISVQEASLTEAGEGFDRFKAQLKPQSAHAIVVGRKLDDLIDD